MKLIDIIKDSIISKHIDYGSALVVNQTISDDRSLKQITDAFFLKSKKNIHRLNSKYNNRITVSDLVFMDIETTGLGGTPLFLIGLLFMQDDHFIVKQFFARDYSEEKAVIAFYFDELKSKKIQITFNGINFDVPYIKKRSEILNISNMSEVFDFDLLPECRNYWRSHLPNCRLQTIESEICGRPRMYDIPGRLIPGAYTEYLNTGKTDKIKTILHHNFLDLITMIDIMNHLPE